MQFSHNFELNKISLCIIIEVGCHIFLKTICLFQRESTVILIEKKNVEKGFDKKNKYELDKPWFERKKNNKKIKALNLMLRKLFQSDKFGK